MDKKPIMRDISGRVVLIDLIEEGSNLLKIDISDVPSGIYFIGTRKVIIL